MKLHIKAYRVIARAIDDGITCGLTQADDALCGLTDTDDDHRRSVMHEHVEREVLAALDEVIDFGDV